MNKEAFKPPKFVKDLNEERIERYINAEIKKEMVDYSRPSDPRMHLDQLDSCREQSI